MQAGILNAVELRVLRYVLAVVDAGSVVGAADQLQTSQPSLSRQIRRLEGDLGFALFRRGAGPLQLTAAGRRFVPLARDLLDRADAVERAARALARGRLRDVAIAATSTTHSDVIAPFLVTLGPEDPWPELRHESSDGVYRALERGADLAVGPHRPPERLAHLLVAHFPVLAHVRADHPWAERESIALSELTGEPLLVGHPGFHARRRLDAALTEAEVVPDEMHEFETSEVALAVAASGRGVAVVTDDPRFGLVSLRIVDDNGPLLVTQHAAWDPTHHANLQLEALAHRLAAFCATRYPD